MSSIPGSPEAVCVEISYDLSSDQAHRLRHCFEDLAAQGRDVVIDCSKVERMDSSGVGALVFLFKRLRANHLSLRIVGLRGHPMAFAKLLRIDKAIHFA